MAVSVYSAIGWLRLGPTGAALRRAVLAVLTHAGLARRAARCATAGSGVVVGVVLGALASLILLVSPVATADHTRPSLRLTVRRLDICLLMLAVIGCALLAATWNCRAMLDALALDGSTALESAAPP